MGLKDELVALNDPQEKEEEEEEEDLVDIQDTLKTECQEDRKCQKLQALLDQCAERVENGSKESCAMELMDYVHCVDHCVAKTLFKHLK